MQLLSLGLELWVQKLALEAVGIQFPCDRIQALGHTSRAGCAQIGWSSTPEQGLYGQHVWALHLLLGSLPLN